MRVLGISTSRRKWGNTDLLTAAVLNGCREAGAEVELLRPADLELKPCTGCMRCVFQSRDCVIPDRLAELYEAVRRADAFVFGSPTYVLAPNSVQKNVQDRLIQLGRSHELRGKPAVAVVTAGVRGWEGTALALTAQQPLFLGMRLVDRFVGHAQGPGEILENAEALARAARAGKALAKGGEYVGEEGACPLCKLDLFTPLGEGRARCAVCGIDGGLDGAKFIPDEGALPRYSRQMMDHHFNERVLPSGPRFKEKMRHYAGLVAEFRQNFEGEASK